jgi:hypothetical protein
VKKMKKEPETDVELEAGLDAAKVRVVSVDGSNFWALVRNGIYYTLESDSYSEALWEAWEMVRAEQ